jgi:ATP-binding protein involved in chromosome partitioning
MKSYHDIVGDGGSDVLGQVTALRSRIDARLAQVRHVVAVASGKGGVGKSTLTFQLACALHAAGRRVAVLDADLNGPTQARLAGLRDGVFVPTLDGLAVPRSRSGVGVVSLGMAIPEGASLEFESVASGESQTWRATREYTLLGELMASLDWGPLDVLLLDLPPGAERTVQAAEWFGPQVAFVLVTIPSDVSRGVVSRSLAALRRTRNPVLGYIENMAGYWCADCGTVKPLFPETSGVELHGLPSLGKIPFDPELAARCDRGEPLEERGEGGAAAAALHALARRVEHALEEATLEDRA